MTVVVAAAVIERDNRYLVTRRVDGTHLAGFWEFPGGKCVDGESLVECLRREILEELGTDATVGDRLHATTHEYAERTVAIHFFSCTLAGEPRPIIGQQMKWAARDELRSLQFPPADDELIRMLEKIT